MAADISIAFLQSFWPLCLTVWLAGWQYSPLREICNAQDHNRGSEWKLMNSGGLSTALVDLSVLVKTSKRRRSRAMSAVPESLPEGSLLP